MIKNCIIIALRSLGRQKLLAFINILGLSVGLACFSLFLLYAVNEFSFDRVHSNATNIYRIYNWWNYEGRSGSEPASTTPLGPAIKQDLPDVKNYVRFQSGSEKLVRVNDKMQYIRLSFADPQIFLVFTFPLISGNSVTALQEDNSVVLTKDKALQLFGETNVIGKIIEIKIEDRFEPFLISAVAENTPVNSSLRFDMLGSFNYVLNTESGKASAGDWNMTIGIEVFVQLNKGSKLMHETDRLTSFRQKYFPNEKAELIKNNLWNGKNALPNGYGLQPLRDVHTNVKIDQWGAVDPKNIWTLVSIAAGILLIACINFTTLAIGRSAGRIKEVGVRKVLGSRKSQLIYQFLSESIMLSVLSAVIAFGIVETLLPVFNELSGSSLSFSFSRYPELTGLLGGLILIVGIVSGGYPALVLSGFKPIDVLKNKLHLSGSNAFTRSLVTFQFVLSIGLIISTVIILQQISFIDSKNLGFNKENVIMVDVQDTDTKKIFPLFSQALKSEPEFIGVTSSIGLGAGEGQMGGGYEFNGNLMGVIEYPVDGEYFKVMGMELIAGRTFNQDIASDTINSVIVNETLVKQALRTTPENAIGWQFKSPKGNRLPKTIIGVSRDFNFEDLTRVVRPQLFFQSPAFNPSRFFIRIQPGNPSSALLKLESVWESLVPDVPLKHSFVDEKFESFYKAEQKWSSIVGYAGAISIFLACLGLFGLAALYSINRKKEISIRKVSGATLRDIVVLFSKDFLKLIIIALVIASPIVWYIMNNWLQDFAYRIDISLWVFVISGGIALLLALLTIGFQAIKAAIANPIEALRYD